MNKQEKIDRLVEDAFSSLQGIERATAKPYLLTRIKAAIASGNSKVSMWEKAISIIGKPTIALSGLCMVILINVLVVIYNHPGGNAANITEQAFMLGDDDATTIATIYETENP